MDQAKVRYTGGGLQRNRATLQLDLPHLVKGRSLVEATNCLFDLLSGKTTFQKFSFVGQYPTFDLEGCDERTGNTFAVEIRCQSFGLKMG